jgi:uncharacterized repeat protein (TIGR01451 family)
MRIAKSHRTIRTTFITTAVMLVISLAAASASALAAPTAHWQILTQPAPTYFHPGDALDFYEVVAVNDGAAPSSGQVVLKDVLPPGVVVTSVASAAGVADEVQHGIAHVMSCTVTGTTVQTVECTAEEPVPIGDRVGAKINVEVPIGASGVLRNEAVISGGTGGEASVTTPTPVVAPTEPVPYGATVDVEATGENGEEVQAGGRPTTISTIFATHVRGVSASESCEPPGQTFETSPGCAQLVSAPRNIEIELPAGLVGNATSGPRCTQAQFQSSVNNFGCPSDTQVGFAYFSFFGAWTAGQNAAIYNIVPPLGQPAEFGFTVGGQAHIPMFFHVHADGTYTLDARLSDLTSFDAVRMAELSIWGVPSSPIHNEKRCEVPNEAKCEETGPAVPLLRMPTSCTSANPLAVLLRTDSEGAPGLFVGSDTPASIAPMTGCDRLKFAPALEARPTTNVGDSPTGLHVDLRVPQNEDPNDLATADLRKAVVQLPPNLTVNPSSANGLEGCSLSQLGATSPVGKSPITTTEGPAACPDGSKIGTVEIDTPLLDSPLPGAVYLASPYENPFNSLLAIYIAINDPKSGVVVKLAGHVEIGAEGQLTATFDENPQLPFEDFKLDFFGGPGAALKTPAVCGDYETKSTLTPWSAPESGPPTTPADGYSISAAPGGGRCATTTDQLPDNPAFEAGSEAPFAGVFSPFVLRLRRDDGSQQFSSLTVTPPPGLVGSLVGIPYCSDADLATGRRNDRTSGGRCPELPGRLPGRGRKRRCRGWSLAVLRPRPRLPHRALPRCPTGLGDHHAGGRGPVRPGYGRRAFGSRGRSVHRTDHGEERPDPDPVEGHPAGRALDRGEDRSARFHAQPNEL